MYKIAEYLTDDEKRKALAHEYTYERLNGTLTDTYGYCPLGRALQLLPYEAFSLAPFPCDIVDRLYADNPYKRGNVSNAERGLPPQVDKDLVLKAAQDFTDDWDTGKIEDLANALGVIQ